jgi:hypothetical protein
MHYCIIIITGIIQIGIDVSLDSEFLNAEDTLFVLIRVLLLQLF